VRSGIAAVYEKMMGRPADTKKLDILLRLYDKALTRYRQQPGQCLAMSGPLGEGVDRPSAAASVVVANAMLNMDEFITKN
jgi:hypothetical protein